MPTTAPRGLLVGVPGAARVGRQTDAQRFGQAGYIPLLVRAGLPAHQVPYGPGVVPVLGPRVGQGGEEVGDQAGDRHPGEQFARHALVEGVSGAAPAAGAVPVEQGQCPLHRFGERQLQSVREFREQLGGGPAAGAGEPEDPVRRPLQSGGHRGQPVALRVGAPLRPQPVGLELQQGAGHAVPVEPRQEKAAVGENGITLPVPPPQGRPMVQDDGRKPPTGPVEHLEADVPETHASEPGQRFHGHGGPDPGRLRRIGEVPRGAVRRSAGVALRDVIVS
ncbi:hypothetical protein [Streptomyces erythrochromogenes]|uniref:hypothetical protein n=1 Tax=Streptomyces erythrochromogenes TaxID=285574 RepID=UPI00367495D9